MPDTDPKEQEIAQLRRQVARLQVELESSTSMARNLSFLADISRAEVTRVRTEAQDLVSHFENAQRVLKEVQKQNADLVAELERIKGGPKTIVRSMTAG